MENIYKDYIYESASSPDLRKHFNEYAGYINNTITNKNAKVLEIGANDGLLLKKLVKLGFKNLVAIDPSPQTRKVKYHSLKIINQFFNKETASLLQADQFDIIIANNCFSHIPKLSEIFSSCNKLLKKTGILIIEVQSTLSLFEKVIFDYIYHEHIFYHTATSIEKVAKISGMQLFKVEPVETKGGSYRLFFAKYGTKAKDGSVEYWKYREKIAGVHDAKQWVIIKKYLKEIKSTLVKSIPKKTKKVIGYGASATGTVLIQHLNLKNRINLLVDDNKKRQKTFAPGTGFLVSSPQSCQGKKYCIILAWRHAKKIAAKLNKLSIPYIIPLPFIRYEA